MTYKPQASLIVLIDFFLFLTSVSASCDTCAVASDNPIFQGMNEAGTNVLYDLSIVPPPTTTVNSFTAFLSEKGFMHYKETGCCECEIYFKENPDKAPAPRSVTFFAKYNSILSTMYKDITTAYNKGNPNGALIHASYDYRDKARSLLSSYSTTSSAVNENPYKGYEEMAKLMETITKSSCKADYTDDLVNLCFNSKMASLSFSAYASKDYESLKRLNTPDQAARIYQACLEEHFGKFDPFSASYCYAPNGDKVKTAYSYYKSTAGKEFTRFDFKTWNIYTIPTGMFTIRSLLMYTNDLPTIEQLTAEKNTYVLLGTGTKDATLKTYYQGVTDAIDKAIASINSLIKEFSSNEDYYELKQCCECTSGYIIQGLKNYGIIGAINHNSTVPMVISGTGEPGATITVTIQDGDDVVLYSGRKNPIFIPSNTLKELTSYTLRFCYNGDGRFLSCLKAKFTTTTRPTNPVLKKKDPPLSLASDCKCIMEKIDLELEVEAKRILTEGDVGVLYYYFYFYREKDFDENKPYTSKPVLVNQKGTTSTSMMMSLANNIYDPSAPVGTQWTYLVGVYAENQYGVRSYSVQTFIKTKESVDKDALVSSAIEYINEGNLTINNAFTVIGSLDIKNNGKEYKEVIEKMINSVVSTNVSTVDEFQQTMQLLSNVFINGGNFVLDNHATVNFLESQLKSPQSSTFITPSTAPDTLATISGLMTHSATSDQLQKVNSLSDLFISNLGLNLPEEANQTVSSMNLDITVVKSIIIRLFNHKETSCCSTITFEGPTNIMFPEYDNSGDAITYGYKAWKINPFPNIPNNKLTNYVSLDLYKDLEGNPINDLTTPIQICSSVPKGSVSQGDTALGYIDEVNGRWKCQDECLAEVKTHNSSHDMLCGKTNHLTTFSFSFIGTQESFSWEKVRIVYPVIIFGFFTGLAALWSILINSKNYEDRIRINSERDEITEAGENKVKQPSSNQRSYVNLMKSDHNFISLFYNESNIKRSLRVVLYLTRWYLIILISTLLFYGRSVYECSNIDIRQLDLTSEKLHGLVLWHSSALCF